PENSQLDGPIPTEQSQSLLNGKVALVVDDNEMHRNGLHAQLTYWGVQTDVTESSEGAFLLLERKQADSKQYDFALIDSTILNGTGEGLVTSLSERFPSLRCILLIGLEDSASNDPAGKTSNLVTITKPISCFTLYDAIVNMLFDVTSLKRDDNSYISQSTASRMRHHRTSAIRVLVAEDNRINQIVIKGILDAAGMDCEIVDNGQDAFEKVTELTSCFDLILMDCQMPNVDGYQATQMIREYERQHASNPIPIIALTANAISGDKEKCLESGMNAYCSKPIDPKLLLETIYHWLC
ncbi:MAG: response regulator, partial [Thermoguttaceae bacterium]